ncbi:uncharacterized protein LOC106882722 [Octopus bimaculoides]|uniref:uncharacterized protein LOC106882722 n=1 Tax=Octopus bimaculoides TaxID=37653 RepID=UPI00071C42F0|nr:uncharacterized protein LOC106882722 [Octopus bimaculoides]|eukprot:XP_014788978.1 PREDICTED: uncharacterized protein LOC106882722 [Octopus bimaculoides]
MRASVRKVEQRNSKVFFKVNYQTVNNIVKSFQDERHCRVKSLSGEPNIASDRQKRALKREIIRNRHFDIEEIANNIEMSLYSVRKVLKELGYESSIARKKPLISDINNGESMTKLGNARTRKIHFGSQLCGRMKINIYTNIVKKYRCNKVHRSFTNLYRKIILEICQ